VTRFRDRADAGASLAHLVAPVLHTPDAVVLGVPRGGMVVARALADALSLPLDMIAVRKLGVPGHEEFGFGAVGEDGVTVLDQATLAAAGLSDAAVAAVAGREREELERRVAAYAGARVPAPLKDREVVVVDDGIAMGGTVRAAIAVCRARGAARIIVAVGVAPPEAIASLGFEADAAVAALEPRRMSAVGEWYLDFRQTTDDEVLRALAG
jgi:putative phosphoribosyl transferase